MESKIIILLGVIGVLVFLTNLIVEVFKRILPQNLPTDLLVFFTAILVSESALFGYNMLQARQHIWFEYVAVVIVGFIVAYVAMFSWAKLTELWNRSKKPE